MKNKTRISVHKDGVSFYINDMRITAKNPRIQPFNQYIYNGPQNIMYFYYDIMIQQKRDRKWHHVHTGGIYEFGVMQYLEEHLNQLLALDCKNEGIRHYFMERNQDGTTSVSTTEFEAVYPHNLSGMLGEDVFNFTKHYKTFTDCRGLMEFEFYDISILVGGNELGKSPIGVYLETVERCEIEVMRDWAHAFMELAGNIIKAEIESDLTSEEDSELNEPKIVREHLKKQYNIEEWRPIFLHISKQSYVLEEYVKYITGKLTKEKLRCNEWHGEKRSMQQLLETMEDYEAYMYIVDDNHH